MNGPLSLRGSALLAALAAIAFLSLIVVALTTSMKTERNEAHFYAARASADLMAWYGIETVKASLQTACSNGNAWASGPGGLTYVPSGGTAAVTLPLLSAIATNGTGVRAAPDLNRAAVTDDGQPVITGPMGGGNVPMRVGWIYVYQDGTVSTNQVPTLTAANPVIGRFAYWADDESSRINLNAAGGVSDTSASPNHPSRVGFGDLFGPALASLTWTNATNNPFATVNQARLLSTNGAASTLPSLISSNRYSLSATAYSPTLNPLGQQKILLTTQASLTNGTGITNFLNVLATPNSDPGPAANISQANLTATLVALTNALSTNLPVFNASFAQKYTPYNPARITQLALDIIEYVRSAESANPDIQPIRGAWNGSVFDLTQTLSTNTFIGNSRHPVVTQLAVWMSSAGTQINSTWPAGYRLGQIEIGVWLPPSYGLSSYSLANCSLIIQTALSYPSFTDSTTVGYSLPLSSTNITILPDATIPAGGYRVITAKFAYTNSGGATIPSTYPVRVSLYDIPTAGGAPFETTSLMFGVATPVPVISSASAPAVGDSISLSELSDPRTGKNPDAWATNVTDKLGAPTLALTQTNTVPPQDTDDAGHASPASLVMPSPKGTAGAPGRVTSVAELGYITTGAEGTTNAVRAVPWRTIRLQPTPAASMQLPPDWALLDFFMAPISTNNASIYQAQSNALAGRINVNGGLPFTNNPAIVRSAPLWALFRAAGSTLTNNPSVITNQVAAMTLATGGTNYGLPCYLAPGELAEIQGVSDGGESSEVNLHNVVDLATTQGGAFHVYSIGQALKQTTESPPNIVVLSEQYKEAVIRAPLPGRSGPTTLLWKIVPP